jgi:hypothetical protein
LDVDVWRKTREASESVWESETQGGDGSVVADP